MLVEQLIRETLEMRGFRIESVVKASSELIDTIVSSAFCQRQIYIDTFCSGIALC